MTDTDAVDAARFPRRALILAGGGMKVAFQAGVLQVLLDEARLDGQPLGFVMADGASGGVFNLAMWCQGMSGTQIADNWRTFRPRASIDPNLWHLPRLMYAGSLFRLRRMRRHVLPAWGLRWDAIRASNRLATFNVYNFSKQRLETITQDRMTEDHLLAAVALPMWFPPVTIDGDRYIDAVFATDGNLEEAIRRGADELWVIWTVSRRGEWRAGFVAQYFQIIEAAANSRLDGVLERIKASNAAIALGEAGEFGRTITVHLLTADVPLHYLINFGRDRFGEAVNAGVRTARSWCAELGLAVEPAGSDTTGNSSGRAGAASGDILTLRFTERMKGELTATREPSAAASTASTARIEVALTIRVADVDRFVVDPDHVAVATGYVDCPLLGGRQRVSSGSFNLLIDGDHPGHKRMAYDLAFSDGSGRRHVLRATKEIVDDPGTDVWLDTTTARVSVHEGRVATHNGRVDAGAPLFTGVIRIHLLDFLEQLSTFRVEGGNPADRLNAITRFGRLFLGKLWDVYARDVLTSSPL